jgi:ABC-type transporter Mla MlaB component
MATLVPDGPGRYRLEGVISFTEQPSRALQSLHLTPAEGLVTLDVGGLDQSDSVALALLVDWARQGKAAAYVLHVTGASARFQAMMRVTGLTIVFADRA